MNLRLLLIFFLLSVAPVAGQTVAEIEEAYGKPTLAYPVTEHIWMTPDFAVDGQVCKMRFYPKRVSRGTGYVGGELNSAELKRILNHIVPPSQRGNVKSPLGIGDFGGGIGRAEYEYEKVSVTFVHSFEIRIDPEALKNSVLVGIDFPISDVELPKSTPTPASESDFDRTGSPEIVILRWNERTCVEDDKGRPNEPRVDDIEERFGQPQKIYSGSAFISLTPDFAIDGQVCEMWVFPKRISGIKNYVGATTLDFETLRTLLNVLVPPEQRGLKQETNFGATATGGPAAWTTYPYENVLFTFMTSFSMSPYSESVIKKGEFKFSIPFPVEPVPFDPQPSEDDFRRDDPQIVSVRWRNRKCSPKVRNTSVD